MGMLTTHFIADKYGRKFGFYWLWFALLIGVCCESFGRDWHAWTAGKVFSMYGVGSVQFLTGSYISEIVPARCRGMLLIFYSVWFGIGGLMSSVALKVLNDNEPTVYLKAVYTEWATIGIMAIVYLLIPESPYWLAGQEQHEKGRAVIKRLNGNIPGYDVNFHYNLVQRTVQLEKERSIRENGEHTGLRDQLVSFKEVFTGSNGLRTFIAFWPAFLQQLMGLQVLGGYGTYFVQASGFTDPFLFGVLQSLCGLLITIVMALIIDHIGRRTIFLGSMSISWTVIMIIGGIGVLPTPLSGSLGSAVTFFSLCWVMFGGNLGTLGWAFCAEVPSSRLRAKTAGIAAAGGVCMGLVFSTSVPYMLNKNYANWGLKTCFFFAGVSAPFCAASFFIVPELSKRTPAEVDEMFEKKIKPWRFKNYVTDAQKALTLVKETGETDIVMMQEKLNAKQ